MFRVLLVIAFAVPLVAQQCPQDPTPDRTHAPSEVRTLEGKLVFHDVFRQWFELKLKQPVCGQTSIELWTIEHVPEVMRGCRVRSRGVLNIPITGALSAPLYQVVEDAHDVQPVGKCVQKPPFPDYSRIKLDAAIREYQVELKLNYRRGDPAFRFRISSGDKDLRPWQAYASYVLTSGSIIYGKCGEGFVVDKTFGTPKVNMGHFGEPRTQDDMATFDPEWAPRAGMDLLLGYTCVRAK